MMLKPKQKQYLVAFDLAAVDFEEEGIQMTEMMHWLLETNNMFLLGEG